MVNIIHRGDSIFYWFHRCVSVVNEECIHPTSKRKERLFDMKPGDKVYFYDEFWDFWNIETIQYIKGRYFRISDDNDDSVYDLNDIDTIKPIDDTL